MKRLAPLLLLGLAGCANYYATRPDLAERVEQWIADYEYRLALHAISQVKPDHPDYPRLQAKERALRSLIAGQEQDILEQARQFANREQWLEADATYARGLAQFPDSERIRTAREAFLAQRERRMRELRLQAWVNEARTLLRNRRLYTEMTETAPDHRLARREGHTAERRAYEAARVLVSFAEQGFAEGNHAAASEYLALAARLSAEPRLTTTIEKLQAQYAAVLREQQGRERRARARLAAQEAQVRAARSAERLEQYRLASAAHQWVAAREHLAAAHELAPEDAALAAERVILETRIAQWVATENERGRLMYAQGKVEEALEVWMPLLELAPDDEDLRAHVERAQRVLRKLEQLGRQPATTSTR